MGVVQGFFNYVSFGWQQHQFKGTRSLLSIVAQLKVGQEKRKKLEKLDIGRKPFNLINYIVDRRLARHQILCYHYDIFVLILLQLGQQWRSPFSAPKSSFFYATPI